MAIIKKIKNLKKEFLSEDNPNYYSKRGFQEILSYYDSKDFNIEYNYEDIINNFIEARFNKISPIEFEEIQAKSPFFLLYEEDKVEYILYIKF